tara:strand:- start:281 stop:427 length:147 start_codon:yes stop_codon:yes gene_type:complete
MIFTAEGAEYKQAAQTQNEVFHIFFSEDKTITAPYIEIEQSAFRLRNK